MSEQLENLYGRITSSTPITTMLASVTLAVAYTSGSGAITVSSATGAPSGGTFSLTIFNVETGEVYLIFRVTSVAGVVFTGGAEGPDNNAPIGAAVVGTMLTTAAINQIKLDALTPTGVAAGSYTSADITVGIDGRISSAADGGGGGGGITQLTGDVTAGPGSGSQAATLAASGVAPGYYMNANITVDSKGRVTVATSGGGGSGVSLSQLLGDASPTAPTISDFILQLVSPTATLLAFANDSSSGFAGVKLSAQATGNDTNLVAEVNLVPTPPYSFRMRFWPNGLGNQYPFGGGIVLYDVVSGNLVVFGLFMRGGGGGGGATGIEIRVAYFNTLNSFNSSPTEFGWFGLPGRFGLCDILFEDDGTNRHYSIIGDGVAANAVEYYTEPNNTFITPTHVGIFVGPGFNSIETGVSAINQITLIDWTQGT